MELRNLKYFLMIAGEENITKAAVLFWNDLCFVSFVPAQQKGFVLVWKKNHTVGDSIARFIQSVKNVIQVFFYLT